MPKGKRSESTAKARIGSRPVALDLRKLAHSTGLLYHSNARQRSCFNLAQNAYLCGLSPYDDREITTTITIQSIKRKVVSLLDGESLALTTFLFDELISGVFRPTRHMARVNACLALADASGDQNFSKTTSSPPSAMDEQTTFKTQKRKRKERTRRISHTSEALGPNLCGDVPQPNPALLLEQSYATSTCPSSDDVQPVSKRKNYHNITTITDLPFVTRVQYPDHHLQFAKMFEEKAPLLLELLNSNSGPTPSKKIIRQRQTDYAMHHGCILCDKLVSEFYTRKFYGSGSDVSFLYYLAHWYVNKDPQLQFDAWMNCGEFAPEDQRRWSTLIHAMSGD